MASIILTLALLCPSIVAQTLMSQTCNLQRTATIQSGAQAIIGGVIKIHEKGSNGYGCGVPTGSMQAYEALRWALNLINKKNETLNGQYLTDYYVPGIRLGMQIMLYCGSSDESAVAAVPYLFPGLSSDTLSCVTSPSNMTLGIVGTSDSGSTNGILSFSKKFNIPVISYASTFPDLTYSKMFSNFLRTIPPDGLLTQVLGLFLVRLNWKYIVVVYEDSTYGQGAYDHLRSALSSAGICLTAAIRAEPDDTTQATVQSILGQAVAADAVGAIFLGSTPLASALLREGANVNGAGKLQWIFTDSVPLDSDFSIVYPRGIISIVPASRYIVEFEDHWVRIDEENPSVENPWFKEWYMQKYNCSLNGVSNSKSPCSSMYQGLTAAEIERRKRLNFVQDQFVEPAVHTVFAYAAALRKAQADRCGISFSGICPSLVNMTHQEFLVYLKAVNFTYAARERVPSLASDQYAPYYAAKKLLFDSKGDLVNPSFSIWNYNNIPNGEGEAVYRFREVGNYISGHLTVSLDQIVMYTENRLARLPALPSSLCPATGCSPCLGLPSEVKYVYIHGDVIINGIFSLHSKGTINFSCGDLASKIHPLYLEAMIYAVTRVNSDSSILHGVKLGALGIDDCMDSVLSTSFITQVQQGLLTIKDQAGNTLDPRKVEAYTGAYDAPLTITLADLMNTFKHPMIGYRASSSVLDDRSSYPYYAKVFPSLEDELRAIILILEKLKWYYIQVIYSTDAYAEEDVMMFKRLAAQAGICIVASFDFDNIASSVLDVLNAHNNVRPVVLLLSSDKHRKFLMYLSALGTTGDFNYVATTTLGSDATIMQGYAGVGEGYITIDWSLSPLTQFFSWLDQQRVNTYTIDPWFTEWFEALYNCSLGGSSIGRYQSQCADTANKSVISSPGFVKELNVGHVINSVYAIARGLNAVLLHYCGQNYNQVCGAFTSAASKGMDLLDEILKVSFQLEDLPLQTFSFDGYSGHVPFIIYNFVSGTFHNVGTVDPQSNTIQTSQDIKLYGSTSTSSVLSVCDQPCLECFYMFTYQNYWYIDGDLLVPAVFDVHFKGSSMFSCGLLRETNGVQYTEAFKYALDLVNSGTTSRLGLHGVQLGGIAFDGCTNPPRSSAIINGVMGRTLPVKDDRGSTVDPSKFISWLTYDSESTMKAANLLQMINMPVVTPFATAPQLFNKTRYRTFFRTIPSDALIAKGMADLLGQLKKFYVITLNAPDEGSRGARDKFREYLKDYGICVIASFEFETDGTIEIILKSISESTTQFVAVFSEPDQYISEMLQYKNDHLTSDIIFISNRWWDLQRLGFASKNVVYRSLAFRLQDPTVTGFIRYLENLSLTNTTNPWLPEYYEALFKCNLAGSSKYDKTCEQQNLGHSNSVQQDLRTLSTINAVHALALALDQTLQLKCGANYSGVCTQFLTGLDTLDIIMQKMDNETFTDIVNLFFDFVEREANRNFELLSYNEHGISNSVGTLTSDGKVALLMDTALYSSVRSQCSEDCLVCLGFESNFRNFSYRVGDLYIIGLFDVHNGSASPYACGSINDRQGLQLLEAFNYAVEVISNKTGLFTGLLRGVRIGSIGFDVCKSPLRAANLVANFQSGRVPLVLPGGLTVNPRQILAYVGPFDTSATIAVAEILSAIGIPQITYGAMGIELQDPVRYSYLLRSVPADDKQSRAVISYLKFFNLTNVQVISTFETIGEMMKEEFIRLALLNLVCITKNYTVGETGVITDAEATEVIGKVTSVPQASVVVLLVDDPFPILKAAGKNPTAQKFLWVATNRWGFNPRYLDGQLSDLLRDRSSKNVIIFDIETADVPGYDVYLERKTPDNYHTDPWFQDYYEFLFGCVWNADGSGTAACDKTRGISRADNYIQDPYVLYVVNAVFSAGLAIHRALYYVCSSSITDGICPKFEVTGNRRDLVLNYLKEVNFTDDTMQPFYYEATGQSSRGFHVYNVTTSNDGTSSYMYRNVGSYNDTHFLKVKLDITYDVIYEARCTPFVNCTCKFPPYVPSRYMLKPSPSALNLVFVGDIHEGYPDNPFMCSNTVIGRDFFRMMAFFYAISSVNINSGLRYPDSLRLGGLALDTCSSTLRLDQDIFNLLSGYALCDTSLTGQVIAPSTVVAIVPDGNENAVGVSEILAPTNITLISPTATSSELNEYYMSSNFLSIVPPDERQALIILQIMDYLSWDYATIIYTQGAGNLGAMNELLNQASTARSVCFGQALGLPQLASIADAENILEQVGQQVGSKVVVLFTTPDHTRLVLQAAKNKGLAGRYVWLGTTTWGQSNEIVSGLEQEASGAITLQPHSVMVDDFRNFIKSLTYTNRQGVPDDWFEEIYQTLHQCVIQEAKRPLPFSSLCTKTEQITDDMVPYDPTVLHTIIAVYMVAQGLNNIPSCKSSSLTISACLSIIQNRHQSIYEAILNSEYRVLPTLLGSNSFSFSFDKNGYGNIGIDILNFHSDPSGSGYIYSLLGSYTDQLNFTSRNYQGLSLYDVGVIPNSNCVGSQCKCSGPVSLSGTSIGDWTYEPSTSSAKVNDEGRTYYDPQTGQFFYVEKIPSVTSRFSDMWGVAVSTLAAIGVFSSLALFIYLLVVYPVRGGTSILGYVLAFGIILLYGLVFAFVAHASVELCGLRRFCLGICYAICYGSLFVKLVDCWRSREKEDMFEVKYNKLGRPLGFFMVVVLLVLVQVIINVEWLILEPPKMVRIFYNSQYWPRCTPHDFSEEGLVLSLCYIMVIIFLTIILGLCTFNSRKNHHESRWILGIAILAVPTWVVWCAWAILGAIRTRDAAVAIGLLVNATILLLLGPVRKLYLLNKYQALVDEEEKKNLREQQEKDYASQYEKQYDNHPRLHDISSAHGSTRGSTYRYPPSSMGRSGAASYRR